MRKLSYVFGVIALTAGHSMAAVNTNVQSALTTLQTDATDTIGVAIPVIVAILLAVFAIPVVKWVYRNIKTLFGR